MSNQQYQSHDQATEATTRAVLRVLSSVDTLRFLTVVAPAPNRVPDRGHLSEEGTAYPPGIQALEIGGMLGEDPIVGVCAGKAGSTRVKGRALPDSQNATPPHSFKMGSKQIAPENSAGQQEEHAVALHHSPSEPQQAAQAIEMGRGLVDDEGAQAAWDAFRGRGMPIPVRITVEERDPTSAVEEWLRCAVCGNVCMLLNGDEVISPGKYRSHCPQCHMTTLHTNVERPAAVVGEERALADEETYAMVAWAFNQELKLTPEQEALFELHRAQEKLSRVSNPNMKIGGEPHCD